MAIAARDCHAEVSASRRSGKRRHLLRDTPSHYHYRRHAHILPYSLARHFDIITLINADASRFFSAGLQPLCRYYSTMLREAIIMTCVALLRLFIIIRHRSFYIYHARTAASFNARGPFYIS